MMKNLLLFFLFSFFLFSMTAQNVSSSTTISQDEFSFNVNASPNPFTYMTKISFELSEDQNIQFEVKNILGKRVYYKQFLGKKGKNEVDFYRDNLSQGMYMYSIQADEYVISKRLVLK